ncbi:MAG: DUF4115 domain-containing protein [Methylococcaceae bacterium]|nr:DUF4115 domain-containing protein [Methylococcaceae bacterium]
MKRSSSQRYSQTTMREPAVRNSARKPDSSNRQRFCHELGQRPVTVADHGGIMAALAGSISDSAAARQGHASSGQGSFQFPVRLRTGVHSAIEMPMVPVDSVSRPGKSVCITSRRPGEGKTSVTLRLAGALARSGARVALVDLGTGAEHSLTARFAPSPPSDSPQQEPSTLPIAPGIDLLWAPQLGQSTLADDVAIAGLVELMEAVKPSYDLILLDCSSDVLGWCYPLWRHMDAVVAVVCPETMTPDLAWSVAAWIGHPDISALFLLNKARPGRDDIGRLEGVAAGIGRMRFGGSPKVLGQVFQEERLVDSAVATAFGEPEEGADSGMERIVGQLRSALEPPPPPQPAIAEPEPPSAESGAAGGPGRFIQELAEGFVAEGVFLAHVGQLLSAYCEGHELTRSEALRRLIEREAEGDDPADLVTGLNASPDSAGSIEHGLDQALENLPQDALVSLAGKLEEVYRRRFSLDLHDPLAQLIAQIAGADYRKEQFAALQRTLLRAFTQRFGRPYRDLRREGLEARQNAAERNPIADNEAETSARQPPSRRPTEGIVAADGDGIEPVVAKPVERTQPGSTVRSVPSARTVWLLAAAVVALAAGAAAKRFVGKLPALQITESTPGVIGEIFAPSVPAPVVPAEAVAKPAEAVPVAETVAAAPLHSSEVDSVQADSAAPEEKTPAVVPAKPVGLDRLRVEVREDCWIQVADRHGRRLGSDLLKIGTVRDYQGAGPLQVALGNAGGVSLQINDVPVDMSRYQRHRTARLTLPEPGPVRRGSQ